MADSSSNNKREELKNRKRHGDARDEPISWGREITVGDPDKLLEALRREHGSTPPPDRSY